MLSNLGLPLFASGLESHLEGIRLDDQERVRLVQRDLDLALGDGIDLPLEIESPHQTATASDSFVTGDGHAQALTLAPAKGRHTIERGELGQRPLECRPAFLEPPFRAVGLWVGVLDGVAEEGIVERQDAGSLGNEVAAIPVISFTLVGNTCETCQLGSNERRKSGTYQLGQ